MATQEAIEEMQTWQKRLRKISVDEALALLGQPAREFGPRSEKRVYGDGTTKIIEYTRGFEFDGILKTFPVLRLDERSDGRLELAFLPRATTPGEWRRRLVIIGLVVVALAVLPAWRWAARKQWITQSTRELQQRGAPPAELMQRIQSRSWTGRNFLVFSNGWATLTYHTVHQSMSIGDIALMLTSEGDLYRSDFHFCLGVGGEFDEERQSRPNDISQFLQIYGPKHHWKKLSRAEQNHRRTTGGDERLF